MVAWSWPATLSDLVRKLKTSSLGSRRSPFLWSSLPISHTAGRICPNTFQQFSGCVWLNYDRAFREHAAAPRVTNWSAMDVQLYNFHAADVAARGRPGESAILLEPVGDRSATVKCRSWNRGRCIAPSGSCRFAHTCSACGADHRASVCPGRTEKEVNTDPKHRASSPLLDRRSRGKSRRSWFFFLDFAPPVFIVVFVFC